MKYSLPLQHGDTADEITGTESTGTQRMAYSTAHGPSKQYGQQSTQGKGLRAYRCNPGIIIDHSHSTEHSTMPQLKRLTLDEILKSLRKRRRKRERLQRLAQSPKTPQSYSPYYTDSIFAGVTIDEPKDLGLNYIDSAFKTLITGPKRLEVRGVFCAYLMSYDVNTARIETVKRYGI